MCMALHQQLQDIHDEHPHVLPGPVHLLHDADVVDGLKVSH